MELNQNERRHDDDENSTENGEIEITLGIVLEMNVQKRRRMNRFQKKDVQLNGMPTNKQSASKYIKLYGMLIFMVWDINF